ncbi:CotS family spore coat protein [Bacillaceae bacterium]
MNAASSFETCVLCEYDFPLHSASVMKPGRLYKIQCEWGTFVLKKSRRSRQGLYFIAEAIRFLHSKGFFYAVPFYGTKYGEPFVFTEKACYYVTEWIPAVPGATSSGKELFWTRLAEMHQLSMGFQYDHYEMRKLTADNLFSRWKRGLQTLRECRELAEQRKFASPFDVAFLANYHYICDMAELALKYLGEWRDNISSRRILRTAISHGRLHEGNVLVDGEGELYFIDFDHANLDTPVRDLALCLRRILSRTDWDADSLFARIARYESVCPLTREERLLLAICLLYPQQVLQDVSAYYGRARDWSEWQSVKNLERHIHHLMLARQTVYELM